MFKVSEPENPLVKSKGFRACFSELFSKSPQYSRHDNHTLAHCAASPEIALSDKTRKGRVGSKAIERESYPVAFIKGGKIRASTIYELTSSMELSVLEKPTVAQLLQEFYETEK
jgi:hypothetical protein